MKAKNLLYTVIASVAVGAVIGMLYAPGKGTETRQKLNRLKRKVGLGSDDVEDLDRETLQELRSALHDQLQKIDATLEKA